MHTPNGDPTNLTGSRRGGITAQSEPTAWGAVGPPGEAEVSRGTRSVWLKPAPSPAGVTRSRRFNEKTLKENA